MGVLVVGAEKIEHKIASLKQNLRTVSEEVMANAEAQIRPAWKDVRNSCGNEFHTKVMIQKINPLRNQVVQGTQAFLNNAEDRARIMAETIIENTILDLEKLKRRLQNNKLQGIAA